MKALLLVVLVLVAAGCSRGKAPDRQPPLVVTVKAVPRAAQIGDEITFTAAVDPSPGDQAIGVSWTWDDGALPDLYTSEARATHQYQTAGVKVAEAGVVLADGRVVNGHVRVVVVGSASTWQKGAR